MPTQLPAALIPRNGLNYYLLEDTYFRGGMRVAANAAARDALHTSCKKAGMFVYTQSDGVLWQLQSDLTTYLEYIPRSFYTHQQPVAESNWSVEHNKNSINFVFNVYDDSNGIIVPNAIQVINSNIIVVNFNMPVSGRVTFAFDLA